MCSTYCLLRIQLKGHPKSGLKITAWDQSLVYDGPDRYPAAFYRKLINAVENAKPIVWKVVSLDSTSDTSAIKYIKHR